MCHKASRVLFCIVSYVITTNPTKTFIPQRPLHEVSCCLKNDLLFSHALTRKLLAGMSTILIVNILTTFLTTFTTEEWQSPETRWIKLTPLLPVHLAQLQLSCYSHQYSLSDFTEAYIVAYIIVITHIHNMYIAGANRCWWATFTCCW